MRQEVLHDLLFLLQEQSRRSFRYAADEYIIYLFQQLLPEGGMSIRDLKASSLAKLLARPRAKDLLAQCGDGYLRPDQLSMLYDPTPQSYRISFGEWGNSKRGRGNYYQTTRKGFNLVLQLNYDTQHNARYQQLRRQMGYDPFQYSCHPIHKNGEYTLAWARIDLSDDWSEALIEEIQSDWYYAVCERLRTWKERSKRSNFRGAVYEQDLQQYIQKMVMPRAKLWPETILTASLDFLWKELGTKRIFYHSYETGCRLKNCRPPRSLYSQLPKRFCFQKTKEIPRFLHKQLAKKKEELIFYLLE